jgi:hypothetical protein
MTREIKFRAWDKEHNVMRNFERIAGWSMSELNDKDTSQLYMQYTGLKDKNGKEIYDGDLIKAPAGKPYKVVFEEGCFRTSRKVGEGLLASFWEGEEIIGNVWENPELLN